MTDKEIAYHFGIEGSTAWRNKTGANGENKALLMKVLSDLPIEFVLNRIKLYERDNELLCIKKTDKVIEDNSWPYPRPL